MTQYRSRMLGLGAYVPPRVVMAGLAFGFELFETKSLRPGWFLRLPIPLRFAALYAVIFLVVLCRELNPANFLYFQF